MDSLTHIVLGAVVAEACVGKKAGNKALVWGAVAGSIPDFDVFFSPLFNPVDALFFHRGISHSLLILMLVAPAIALAASKQSSDSRLRYADWLWLIALPWLSHISIDVFNTYGTGILEPFCGARISYDSVAIVDLFLLITLIPAVITIGLTNRTNASRRKVAWASIVFVVGYIGLSVFIKENLESVVKKELQASHKEYSRIQTAPLPLSNLVWMVVIEDSTGFDVEQRNVLKIDKRLQKNRLNKNHQLLTKIKDRPEVKRLIDFTNGLYTVEQQNKFWLIYDLRYASLASSYPNAYVFTFVVENRGSDVFVSRTHPNRSINAKNIKDYQQKTIP